MSTLVKGLLTTLATFVAPVVFAQLAPTGEHYAGRPSDTGFGGTSVNATGTFAAEIPLDLPPARGGLPLPLRITYGAGGVGAAGLGWDIPLSCIQHDKTFAHRRPASVPGALPAPREHTYLSLFGQRVELLPDGNRWVARYGTLELIVRESGGSWLAYDGKGRTYTFVRPASLGNTGLWLLESVSVAGGARVQLAYDITTLPLEGGVGTAINLVRIDYNTHPTQSCSKTEIALTYGYESNSPLSMSLLGDKILVRNNIVKNIDVKARATCDTPLQRLRRYELHYTPPDADTNLPRLRLVQMYGRFGTPEGATALPIATYDYGRATHEDSATHEVSLRYKTTQIVDLPAGVSNEQISGTVLDPSVNAPVGGERYAMWQTLIDVTGDGRPDLVFKKNDKLWVAYNRPGPDGKTTFGVGSQGIAQLSDNTFKDGAFSTHTAAHRRFDIQAEETTVFNTFLGRYLPVERNVVNVWRQAIDINGDGRIDIVDAAEEADHWIVYLNTPGPAGIKWERRSFSVKRLREALLHSNHVIDGKYLPLSRRATGTDVKLWECWRWDGTNWHWYWDGFSNHRCEGDQQQIAERGPEKTFVEWELNDLNGDGYPDLVFNSSPVDFQLLPPPTQPTPVGGAVYPADFGIGGAIWHSFAPSPTNTLRAFLNVVGVRFNTDNDPFSSSVDLHAPSSEDGISEWVGPENPHDTSYQSESVGLADVNGDGLVDRIVGKKAYLGAYSGTALIFSPVAITLPGPLATQRNTHKDPCVANVATGADQAQGLRDLTGDGIPDYYDKDQYGNSKVWIGTGTGFRQPIQIVASGADFRFSHERETCDGSASLTDGGLFDIDGDGRPEVIGLVPNTNTLVVSQLVGEQGAGIPEAGRLTEIDNGYGARTNTKYVSAKQFRDNPVPFPEIVVGSVVTSGTRNLGGSLAETRYAYGNAELVFDSASDRFSFPGYGRSVELHLFTTPSTSEASASQGKLMAAGSITDTCPLAPFSARLSKKKRWLRTQRVGRIRDIYSIRGIGNPNPWLLLDVDSNDARVVGVTHYEWDAKLYETAITPAENTVDCLEMVLPLDFAGSFANNIGTGIDICRAHGFAFIASENSWYGARAPPSDNNIQTQWKMLSIDDFGRPLVTEYDNDLFRDDDNICVENAFATPTGAFPRVLGALASRRSYDCSKNITFASESWAYDGLPAGKVSNGYVKSHSVDRRLTETGALLNTVHVFDAVYDGAGNPKSVRTQRGSLARTVTFAYDPFGLVPTSTRLDATGVPSTNLVIGYDPISLNPLTSEVVGQTRRGMDFDGFGRPIRSTVTPPGGSLGVLSTATYLGFDGTDPNGRRITVKRFSDPVPATSLSAVAGRIGTVFLDELGRERRIELELGSDYGNAVLVVGSRLYDDAGRVTFEADPYTKDQDPATVYGTTYHFKNTGDLNCIIRGRGQQALNLVTNAATERFPTSFQHSFVGHVQTFDISDAASLAFGSAQSGVVKRIVTSAIGRVIERSTLKAGVRLELATFAYDRLGQQTSMVRFFDPAGPNNPVQWSLKLDSLGQTLQLMEPNVAVRSYTYSDWGEPLETHWNDAGTDRQLVRRYDALGRLTAREERNNGITDPETINTYAYDTGVNVSPLVTPTFVLGQLARATSPTSQVTFSYDAFGRVNAQVFTDNEGGLYIEKTAQHADGQLSSLEFKLPDRNYETESVKYAYDSAGRLRTIKDEDASGSREIYNAESIDPFGRVRKALIGGNTHLRADYATEGRRLVTNAAIESPQGSRVIAFGEFDPVGRELSRREVKDGAANGPEIDLAYDALGRLRRAVKSDGFNTIFDWQYRYDPLGNLLQLSNGPASATLSYAAGDGICRVGYGTGGLGGSACNVTYDPAGSIIEQPTRTGLRRVTYFNSGSARDISEGASQARFRYDAFDNVHEVEITGSGVANSRHDRRYGALIERRDQTTNGTNATFISRNIPGPADGIIASRRGPQQDWVFEFGELRGNRFFTNQDGAFVQDVEYQPFGEAVSTGTPVTANYTTYQWNGGDALGAFGLVQLGARLYDPVTGRFLSRDPLLIWRGATTSNPYAFAVNDPINGADPSGLDDCGGNFGKECEGLDSLNTISAIAAGLSWGLSALGGGGSDPASPPPPKVSTGPQISQATLSFIKAGGVVPKGFNADTYANSGASMSAMLDAIANYNDAERNAEIDAYNAKLDRYSNYGRVAGWTLFTVGTFGAGACEAVSALAVSQGMFGTAAFFGGSSASVVAAGGASAEGVSQLEEELGALDEVAVANTEGTVAETTETVTEAPAVVRRVPSFGATEEGDVFPIPKGATGPFPTRAPGMQFTGGSGGYGFNPRVTGVRFMGANTNQGGRGMYMNQSGQIVNPWTGRTDQTKHFYFDRNK